MSLTLALVEHGVMPDTLTRIGIRRLLQQRLDDEASAPGIAARRAYIAGLEHAPLAVQQGAANAQHYEVPARLYELCLGKRLKYSSGWWDGGVRNLDEAEEAMLAKSVAHAGIRDGMTILEIGCGWGSLSLYLAEHFPNARILSISNSNSQREFITARAAARGFTNLTVKTTDICDFVTDATFDRVVSIECFEHLRNYAELFRRIRGWLKPDGRLWTHIFVHKTYTYPFEAQDADSDEGNWMSRHFFTGGQMPSFDLFRAFDRDLVVEDAVAVNGTHYGRTARAWLDNLDRNRREVREVLCGPGDDPDVRLNRWRMFFMSCEELWNFRGGEEWLVGHYLLAPRT
jgi:cyclopropane-fatty-acyl-phospholipid synthase